MIRKNVKGLCALAAAVAVALASTATFADSVTYGFSRFTANGTENPASQITLQVNNFDFDSGDPLGSGFVSFVFQNFQNGGTLASSITSVHFEDGTLLGIDALNQSSGVDFEFPGSHGSFNVPSGESLSPSFATTSGYRASADSPVKPNGVDNPGEWLEVIFELIDGFEYSDVLAAISNGFAKSAGSGFDPDAPSLRVAMHVQGIGTAGDSESLILTIPLPTPLGLGLAGLAGVVIISRRKRKAAVSIN